MRNYKQKEEKDQMKGWHKYTCKLHACCMYHDHQTREQAKRCCMIEYLGAKIINLSIK